MGKRKPKEKFPLKEQRKYIEGIDKVRDMVAKGQAPKGCQTDDFLCLLTKLKVDEEEAYQDMIINPPAPNVHIPFKCKTCGREKNACFPADNICKTLPCPDCKSRMVILISLQELSESLGVTIRDPDDISTMSKEQLEMEDKVFMANALKELQESDDNYDYNYDIEDEEHIVYT